jgi:large subunit ribosomal protein L29
MGRKDLRAQLRVKDTRELRYELDEARKELFEARFRNPTETQTKINIRNVRRQIARLETLLRERELAEAASESSAADEANAEAQES